MSRGPEAGIFSLVLPSNFRRIIESMRWAGYPFSLNVLRICSSFIKLYKQENGAPMGSPLSPVLAEVFMEHFERRVFSHTDSGIAPTYFKRYVDDVFAKLKRGTEDSFLEILNLEFPNVITFTIEKEVEGKIPFLAPSSSAHRKA
ncbi:hypothetical protein M513_11628 [Trichuris suis]|uniref:Reverse transcriptase domain-containing protein n=1 Tax=Trichuris suis TaxID=68888 RepID=A0A085LR71_9BILA|nr:hypothetical protein M513_11628 [Trichuris suis]